MVLSSLLGGLSLDARADDLADEADFHFRLAAKRYEANDYTGALDHFLTSNRLVPNKNVLFNIARTYEQMKQPADAYRYYQRAIEGEPDAATQRRISEAIARIRPQVAVVKIDSDPPGATVYIDRKDLGARGVTPLVLALPPGRYTFLAERPGYAPGKVEAVEAKVGGETTVSVPISPLFGSLRVDGEAEGSDVRLDGEAKSRCTAPCVTRVPVGPHVVNLSKPGYQASDVQVEISVGAESRIRSRLVAVFGGLVVSSDVREASILIDGTTRGFTPAVLELPIGWHEVRVEKPGYETVVRRIEVVKGATPSVAAELTPTREVAAASRSLQSVEDAPASVSIITASELRAMGYPTIAEAVRGIRGLYLSDDRTYDAVGFRGFSRPGDYGNRILVTIDGHSTNDDYAGSSSVGYDARVDLDDIERIEVVRGPGSVLYGTGAFFGVINLVTRARPLKSRAELSGGTALDGVGHARATGIVRVGDDAGGWASVSVARGAGRDYFFSEFRSDPANPELAADGRPLDGNSRGSDGFSAGTISARAYWKFVTLQGTFNTRTKSLPIGAYDSFYGDSRSKVRDTRGFVELRAEPSIGKSVESLSRVHANLYDFYGSYSSPQPVGFATEVFHGRWLGGEQRFVFKPMDELKLTVGGELVGHVRVEQRSADQTAVYTDRDDPYLNGAGYLLADVSPVKRLKISLGARLDYYSNVKFDPVGSTNPRIAVLVDTWPGGKLKLIGGKAFRSPSVYELYSGASDRVATAGLKPEQVVSGELELSHRFTPTVVALLAGYTNYVTNLIELTDSASGLRYENSRAPVVVVGGEAEVRREWQHGFMAGAMLSVQKAKYLDAPELQEVPNSPTVLGSLKGAAPIVGRSLMVMARVSIDGSRFDSYVRKSEGEQLQSRVGVVGDLVFSGEVERLDARYAIGVYNLADSRYDSAPSREYRLRFVPQAGRSLMANVTVSF